MFCNYKLWPWDVFVLGAGGIHDPSHFIFHVKRETFVQSSLPSQSAYNVKRTSMIKISRRIVDFEF